VCVCVEGWIFFFFCKTQLRGSVFSSAELRATEPHPVGL
jgi:hypothetical protein